MPKIQRKQLAETKYSSFIFCEKIFRTFFIYSTFTDNGDSRARLLKEVGHFAEIVQRKTACNCIVAVLFAMRGFLKDVLDGKVREVRKWLEKGANVSLYDEYGNTALHLAAEKVTCDC